MKKEDMAIILVLKTLFLLSPAILYILYETINAIPIEDFISSGVWISVLIPSISNIVVAILYIIAKLTLKTSYFVLFLVVFVLYYLAGMGWMLFYLVLMLGFGASISQSIIIPIVQLLFIAIAIFFTIETRREIKKSKYKKRGIDQ